MWNGKYVHKRTGLLMRLPVVIGSAYVVTSINKYCTFKEIIFSPKTQFKETAAKGAIHPRKMSVCLGRIIYSFPCNPIRKDIRRVKNLFRYVTAYIAYHLLAPVFPLLDETVLQGLSYSG